MVLIKKYNQRTSMTAADAAPVTYDFGQYRNENWLVLDVNEGALELLEQEVNGKEIDWDSRHLDAVLRQLLSPQKCWVLISEPHYDQTDSVYHLTVSDCLQKLGSNYRRDGQKEGFICIGSVEWH